MSAFDDALVAAFGKDRVGRAVRLAPLTTLRVGGPADRLVEPRGSDEIVTALTLADRAGVPVTIVGGGSNVLVSDAGVRGLVLRPRGGTILRVDQGYVRADAAVTINGLVRWAIMNGAAGFEIWAGTPGTVGGAIFGNAHFGGRLIGELVASVRVAAKNGTTADIPASEMAFSYDRSQLQETADVLLSTTFRVSRGDPAEMRRRARESLTYRKGTQPLDTPSAGCIFRNPEPGLDSVPEGISLSAGELVDRAGLKGHAIGGTRVSPTHGNFIVNDGSATAGDIRRLIEHCRRTVRDRFGVELREEIVYLGDFSDAESAV